MKYRIALYVVVAAPAGSPAALAAGPTETIGKFYYRTDPGYEKKACSRVSALLASQLSHHYTCSKMILPQNPGRRCWSPNGPEFVLYDTLSACKHGKGASR